MNEWLYGSYIQHEITHFTGVFGVAVAAVLSIVGGSVGGVLLVGKSSEDSKLAAIIGSLFGPVAVIPATVIVLVVMNFHNSCGHLEIAIDNSKIANDMLVCPYDKFHYGLDAVDCLTVVDLALESDLVDVDSRGILTRFN